PLEDELAALEHDAPPWVEHHRLLPGSDHRSGSAGPPSEVHQTTGHRMGQRYRSPPGSRRVSPLPLPPERPLRSFCSCVRAAICWAATAAWMPWKSPSSQPTSCACAMRSSASVGVDPGSKTV